MEKLKRKQWIVNTSYVNYKQRRKNLNPAQGSKTVLKQGLFVPASIAAELTGVSTQTIRLMYLTNQIKGVKFKTGPLLVDISRIEKQDGKILLK